MNEPILRSFEYQGRRYIFGLAVAFNKRDSHGTVMTRENFEPSETYLRKFGSMRFQHQTPIARLIWDTEIEGHRTEITDSGFTILAEMYDGHDEIWQMIRENRFGLSYGWMPKDVNEPFETIEETQFFKSGLCYEISCVDAPSCENCVACTITRSINNGEPQRRVPCGFREALDEITMDDQPSTVKFPLKEWIKNHKMEE